MSLRLITATIMGPNLARTGKGWAACLIFLGFLPIMLRIPQYSALPLDLVGVIVNTIMPSKSVCLIRFTYPPKNEDIFRPGQKVFDLAEVRAIGLNGVIIQNLVTRSPEYLTYQKNRPFLKSSPLPSLQVITKSLDTVKIDLPKDTVDHYLRNLSEVLDSAYVAPRYREDKEGKKSIEGFEINRIEKYGIVDQLGLKDGDVIINVNGEQLDSLATVMRLLGQIQSMPRATVTVLRGEQKLNFIFERK